MWPEADILIAIYQLEQGKRKEASVSLLKLNDGETENKVQKLWQEYKPIS